MGIKIGIHGAAGRMGRRLVALASQDADLTVVAALEGASCPELGQDAGLISGVGSLGVALSSDLQDSVDCVIDFSVPRAATRIAGLCGDRKIPFVCATTGLTAEEQGVLDKVSQQVPLVWAPNMSLAVNLTMKLTSLAAAALANTPGGADVEIIERHHHFKEDSPSGTALRFGELVAEAMGQTKHQHGRAGLIGARPQQEIGYHALRVGDNPGEHTIVFGMMGETIELTVRATNRDSYARGALAAAKFVQGKAPGKYSMYDVLGL